jgi:hypothetical protein
VAVATNPDIEKAIKRLGERAPEYALYHAYYRGDHRQAFMSEEYKNNYGDLFKGLRCNVCPRVTNALVDRLDILGFALEEGGPDEEEEERARARQPQAQRRPIPLRPPQAQPQPPSERGAPADEGEARPPQPGQPMEPEPEPMSLSERISKLAAHLWRQNRMDRRAGEAHLEAAKMGDAYLIVWPSPDDESRPIIYVNSARLMTVYYDEEEPGRLLWAAKCWVTEEKRVRLNLYYPDRIEKYISAQSRKSYAGDIPKKPASYETYSPPGSTEGWRVANPYGRVPVFHLANDASIGEFGVSELRDIIPLQDALNKAFIDKMVSMEFDAYRQRWATGLEPETDPDTGKALLGFRPGRDKLWWTESPNVEFGEFAETDLAKFNDTETAIIMHIARVSATPMHYMMMQTGNPPSGEAMRTSETPFTAKVKDRQTAWGNVWEDVMLFALRVQEGDSLGEDVRLSTKWTDAAPMSDKEEAETANSKQAAGVPAEVTWKEMGYSDEEIAEWVAEKEERRAEMQAAMGGPPTPPRPGEAADQPPQQGGPPPQFGKEVA